MAGKRSAHIPHAQRPGFSHFPRPHGVDQLISLRKLRIWCIVYHARFAYFHVNVATHNNAMEMIMSTNHSNTASDWLDHAEMPDWTKRIGDTVRTALEAMDTGRAALHDYRLLAARGLLRSRRPARSFRSISASGNTAATRTGALPAGPLMRLPPGARMTQARGNSSAQLYWPSRARSSINICRGRIKARTSFRASCRNRAAPVLRR